MSQSSLGIFLKVPRPGQVKTRIAASLGGLAAASLYTALLRDTVTLASREASRHLHFFVDGGAAEDALGSVWTDLRKTRPDSVHEHRQCDGDLGDRLTAAFADAARITPGPLLVLGSDSPDLPPAHLHRALTALDTGQDAVLGPVADGGVWCIGLCRPFDAFFHDIPWSRADTGAALRNRALELELKLFCADRWYDCDEALDLVAMVHRLDDRAGEHPEAAPATRDWLTHHPQSPLPETS